MLFFNRVIRSCFAGWRDSAWHVRLRPHLCRNVIGLGDVQQVGHSAHQVVLVSADVVVGVGDLPHVFDDASLFLA